jgi:hypothetical protein
MPDGNPIIIGQANTASNPGNETSLSRDENIADTVFVARNVNLERVMNLGENRIETRIPRSDWFPLGPHFPHS